MIPFTPWRPDAATIGNAYATDVRNVLPITLRSDGSVIYAPFPEFAEVSAAANSEILSARGFILPNGAVRVAIGTATKLYFFDATDGSLDDVSGATYSATKTARWHFDIYGTNIIATNVNDGAQRFDVGSSSAFAALSGPTDAHLVSVWKDQLVFGALTNNLEGVQWSEINDITDWSGGNSDTQVFPGFGRVTAISRGNTPLVVQEFGIQRGVFTGTESVFEFDTLTEDLGCRIPGGTAFVGRRAFFWSDRGFKAIDLSGQIEDIGFGKVDRWVRDNVSFAGEYAFRAVADPQRPFVYFACVVDGTAPTNRYNTVLAYNYSLGEWARIAVDLTAVMSWAQNLNTLESLDAFSGGLDALPFSLDSAAYRAEAPVLGGASGNAKLGQFSGQNKAGTMQTGEFEAAPGRRSRLARVRPLIDGPATITHRGRDNRASDMATLVSDATVFSRTQEAKINRTARFHQVEVNTAAAAQWTLAAGVEEIVRPASR